jgi:hypothetical protein
VTSGGGGLSGKVVDDDMFDVVVVVVVVVVMEWDLDLQAGPTVTRQPEIQSVMFLSSTSASAA